jgi:hypothetical protein
LSAATRRGCRGGVQPCGFRQLVLSGKVSLGLQANLLCNLGFLLLHCHLGCCLLGCLGCRFSRLASCLLVLAALLDCLPLGLSYRFSLPFTLLLRTVQSRAC